MSETIEAKGSCLCGEVEVQAMSLSTDVGACHCNTCRKWNGGPFLGIDCNTAVTISGEENITSFSSSEWAERGFCGECGSNLFYRLKEADHYILCAGTFDDESVFELAGEIFVDEKPAGYHFAGDHPRQTGAEFMASLEQS